MHLAIKTRGRGGGKKEIIIPTDSQLVAPDATPDRTCDTRTQSAAGSEFPEFTGMAGMGLISGGNLGTSSDFREIEISDLFVRAAAVVVK